MPFPASSQLASRLLVGLRRLTAVIHPCWYLLLGFAASEVGAQNTRLDKVQHFNERNGLSHNRVNAVLQDQRGFLWVGTQDGLDRYDGYGFRRYAFPQNSSAQMNIQHLHEDASGVLWAVLREGVARFEPSTEELTFLPPAPELNIQPGDLFVFEPHSRPGGPPWLPSPDGLLYVDASTQSIRKVDLSSVQAPVDADLGSFPEAVYDVASGSERETWAAAAKGLLRIQPENGSVESWSLPGMVDGNQKPYRVLIDENSNLWVGTFQGLWKAESGDKSLQRVFPPSDDDVTDDGSDSILFLDQAPDGQLWFLTPKGLHRMTSSAARGGSSESTLFALCPDTFCLEYPYAPRYTGAFDGKGDLWISITRGGLLHFDAADQAFRHYQADPETPGGLSSPVLYDLTVDRQGILWLAGLNGLEQWDARRERFQSYSVEEQQGNLVGTGVWAIHMDAEGILWVGSYENGFSRLDRRRGETTHYPAEAEDLKGLADLSISSIRNAGNGMLWIGSDLALQRFDPATETYWTYTSKDNEPHSLSDSNIFSMAHDRSGRLWVGTRLGVDIYRPDSDDFQRCLEPVAQHPILPYWLAPSGVDGMWAASQGQGVFRFEGDCSQPSVHLQPVEGNANSLASAMSVAVHEDSEGILWVGSANKGLDRWDPQTDTFEHFNESHGLPSRRVLGIADDGQGHLWLATGRGLSRFDKEQRTFRNFDVGDGLLNNSFTIGSVLRAPDGEIFFGGGLGLIAFHPDRIVDDLLTPQVLLTDFQLFHQSVALASVDPDSPLQQTISWTEAVTLEHTQDRLGLEITPLHFANPDKNRLHYRLNGFDDQWVELDIPSRMAQFSNLSAGDYTLEVKAANGDGVWSAPQTVLRLHVLPPPWKTWWAYCLYALALALALWGYTSWQRRRLAREREINRQLRAVDRLKDEFLANTSHELRTPLYGITGLAESLLEGAQGKMSEGAQSNLRMIVSSGQRLAGLVGQILDYSKVQQGKMEVVRRPVDLSTLLEVVVAILQPLIKDKDVRLLHRISPDLPPALADEDRLHQVFINLVGNALKFTEKGEVEISAVEDDAMLIVRVRDTGIGIPQHRQEQIFEAFEQADASIERQHGGTGLGLAVTRELVTLLGGKIWVESKPGDGSTFTFTLPVAEGTVDDDELAQRATTTELEVTRLSPWIETDNHGEGHLSDPEAPSFEASSSGEDAAVESNTARILVVDDESVLREVLYNFLKPEDYEVEIAASGQEGLDLLALRNFDLVLLDVMMPRMSGFEVCARIRRRFSVEELPVIFLTAKNQVSDLVRAFGDGASDYLTKPIARQELLARVRTHLQLVESHRHQQRQVNILTGLLPICAACKRIRDDNGDWQGLESFLDRRTEASFSHSICPDCIGDLYPEVDLSKI